MSEYHNDNQESSKLEESSLSTENTNSPNTVPAMIEKFVIRLPKGLRNKIKHISEQNRRSMNSEIIMVLEKHIQQNLSDQELLATHELLSSSDSVNTMSAQQSESSSDKAGIADSSTGPRPADSEIAKRLENLPEEKKLALLELLG